MQLGGIAAIVTGGASGLGASTARMLAAHGAQVAVFDLNEPAARDLIQDIGGVFRRGQRRGRACCSGATTRRRSSSGMPSSLSQLSPIPWSMVRSSVLTVPSGWHRGNA